MIGKVVSVNSCERPGNIKYPIVEGYFKKDHGLEGDIHADSSHRQVSIFDRGSLRTLSSEEKKVCELKFSENITVEGMRLYSLPINTLLKIGEAVFEITQIGNQFQSVPDSELDFYSIMDMEVVFAIVKKSGKVCVGDIVTVINTSQ